MIELTPQTEPSSPEDAALTAAHHARITAAFRAACERELVLGALAEVEGGLRLAFEEQETAPPALILDTFLTELSRRGVRAGKLFAAPPGLTDAQLDQVTGAFEESVRRIRALMIEYNSYLSAGLPWVFPGGDGPLRERGLSIYRYPAHAAVDVLPEGEAIRITFHPGPLGPITSSGFYVPTRMCGDFTATISYRIRRWAPGPDAASLALFVQDEPSMVRYYTLRQTEAENPDQPIARANLDDELSAKIPAPAETGMFRLARRGDVIASAFHDGTGWVELGEKATDGAPDLFLGAKIWSGEHCDGLEADLFDLTIVGEIPDEQTIVLVERPDPREPR